MKTLKIEIPEGYEIDQEKSTFEKIVFKEIKKGLPKTWEELTQVEGYYIGTSGYVSDYQGATKETNRNVFVTQEQAKASIALAQLSQLREEYRQGWKPDWKNDNQNKHCIYLSNSVCKVAQFYDYDRFLSFQSKEVANEFLENFGSLIEQARPLMS